jgi:hypothetical protein
MEMFFWILAGAVAVYLIVSWSQPKKGKAHQPSVCRPSADCPMCGINLTVEIEGTPEAEPYLDAYEEGGWKKLTEQDCPFCKRLLAVVVSAKGKLYFRDLKWDKEEQKYYQKEASLSEQIEALEEIIENDEEENTPKQIDAAQKKLDALNERLETLEDSWSEKEDRYQGQQMRWQEKADDKFGAAG